MNDAELLADARRGCNDAFTELYRRNLPHVKAVARAILRSTDVDDVCQETFMLAFTRLASFKQHSNFRTWISQIARNRCLMLLRRNHQITNGEAQLLQLDDDLAANDMLSRCNFTLNDNALMSIPARFDLTKLLRVLKPLQRQVLEMAYLDELGYQEIADRLKLTLPSVKGTIHHAKRRVREVHNKR